MCRRGSGTRGRRAAGDNVVLPSGPPSLVRGGGVGEDDVARGQQAHHYRKRRRIAGQRMEGRGGVSMRLVVERGALRGHRNGAGRIVSTLGKSL